MKKRMSKIISILLVSALVVSVGDVARAGDLEENGTEVQLVEDGAEAEPVIGDEVVEGLVEEPSEDVAEEDGDAEFIDDGEELPAPVIEDVQEAPEKKEIEYDEKLETEEKEKKLNAAPEEEEEVLDISDLKNYLATSTPLENDVAINKVSTVAQAEKIASNPDSIRTSAIIYPVNQPFSKVVKLTKGTVLIAAASPSESAYGSWFGIYRDAALTSKIDERIVSRGSTSSGVFNIPKTGNYYVGVRSSSVPTIRPGSEVPLNGVALGVCSFDGSDRVIKSGQKLIVGQKNAKQVNYFKYKATATGYIRTYANEEVSSRYGVKVTLCNSSKKALSTAAFIRNNPTYGVRKGKTYWIRLTNSDSNSDGFYAFQIKSVKIAEKSGKTLKKAVTVKRKKVVKGTIEAGVNQADWYKFKLTGRKAVTISLTGGTDGEFKFTVYRGTKRVGSKNAPKNFKGTLKSRGKWPKGTYYIKVQRVGKTSGYYSMKWS